MFINLYRISILTAFVLSAATVQAQYQQVVLYPQLSDQALVDQLANDFTPAAVLDFGVARDTLFGSVYAENDSLACVYTRHKVYLPPGQDPTQAAFMNGTPEGINTEHTWPQAFGAGAGNARADMHHLHPSKVNVNSARGNLRFDEVPDNDTREWYYLRRLQTSTPGQDIEQYSELGPQAFEPREDHKGNVARAMFYFYTMYRAEAEAEDPAFFGSMRQTLCQWNHEDPVDSLEWHRSMKIAGYQDGKANPFVLDCTLSQRSYCSDRPLVCETTAVRETSAANFKLYSNQPNPFSETTRLSYRLGAQSTVRLRIFNLLGQELKVLVDERQAAGTYSVQWQASETGIYLYWLEVEQAGRYGQASALMSVVN